MGWLDSAWSINTNDTNPFVFPQESTWSLYHGFGPSCFVLDEGTIELFFTAIVQVLEQMDEISTLD